MAVGSQLGLQYGFSPEETKPSLGEDTHVSLNPMDAPEVSYYSGFYRAPLRSAGGGGGSNCAGSEPFWLQRDDEAVCAASGDRASGVHGVRLPIHHRADHLWT